MAWRWRKSIKVLPGVRLNLSQRGAGFSVGPRGFTVSRGADRRYRRTLSVPGTGLSNTTRIGSRKQAAMADQQWTPPPGWGQGAPPAAPTQAAGAGAWVRAHPKTSAATGILGALLLLGAAGGGDEKPTPPAAKGVLQTSQEQPEGDSAAQEAAEQAAADAAASAAQAEAERVAAETAAAEAAAAQAAAAEAAAAEAARVAAEQAAAQAAAQAEAERQAAEQAAAAAVAAEQTAAAPAAVSYANCSEVRAAGAAPIRQGEPGYSTKLDRDRDGIACDT